jgi:glutathione S-transferase
MAEAVLWHIAFSHYNEKARWALDYKRVPHERRAPPPGLMTMLAALWLTRGRCKTFPVLELDGERIGDSTRIIEALEERYPEPPLYPEDPDERRRALDLEDFFDEQLGPDIRLVLFHEVIKNREAFDRYAAQMLPPRMRGRLAPVIGGLAASFVKLRLRVNEAGALERAKVKLEAAVDRLESELDDGEYLVGDRFSVADLTAAALFYPLVRPPEAPQNLPPYPESLSRYFDSLASRPGPQWVEAMFHRHRGTSAATRSRGLAAATA